MQMAAIANRTPAARPAEWEALNLAIWSGTDMAMSCFKQRGRAALTRPMIGLVAAFRAVIEQLDNLHIEYVVAKLAWRLESRSEIQWRDCVEIASVVRLDKDYMWAWAAELAIQADLTELLSMPD